MKKLHLAILSLLLVGCFKKGSNELDPYEKYNRKMFAFNQALDATFLRPPAKLYHAILPAFVRHGVANAFDNVALIPTIANDILQADLKYTIKDTWRLGINTTLGIGGLVDVANTFGLPPHENDLGLTFAKWGKKKSPYLVLPLVGPSTFRDGLGLLIELPVMTPYTYFIAVELAYGLVGLHYLDSRSQFFEAEKLLHEALDPYTFMRDAYLQNRSYHINGEKVPEAKDEQLYVEE